MTDRATSSGPAPSLFLRGLHHSRHVPPNIPYGLIAHFLGADAGEYELFSVFARCFANQNWPAFFRSATHSHRLENIKLVVPGRFKIGVRGFAVLDGPAFKFV